MGLRFGFRFGLGLGFGLELGLGLGLELREADLEGVETEARREREGGEMRAR